MGPRGFSVAVSFILLVAPLVLASASSDDEEGKTPELLGYYLRFNGTDAQGYYTYRPALVKLKIKGKSASVAKYLWDDLGPGETHYSFALDNAHAAVTVDPSTKCSYILIRPAGLVMKTCPGKNTITLRESVKTHPEPDPYAYSLGAVWSPPLQSLVGMYCSKGYNNPYGEYYYQLALPDRPQSIDTLPILIDRVRTENGRHTNLVFDPESGKYYMMATWLGFFEIDIPTGSVQASTATLLLESFPNVDYQVQFYSAIMHPTKKHTLILLTEGWEPDTQGPQYSHYVLRLFFVDLLTLKGTWAKKPVWERPDYNPDACDMQLVNGELLIVARTNTTTFTYVPQLLWVDPDSGAQIRNAAVKMENRFDMLQAAWCPTCKN